MEKRKFYILSIGLLISSCYTQPQNCPSEERVTQLMKKQGAKTVNIESINEVKDIPGLCEVVIRDGINPIIFYINKRGDRVIVGNILDANTNENLTIKRKKELRRLSKDQVAQLEKLVDFEHGEGNVEVYYITDPDCKICRQQEKKLLKWAEENKVKLKVILYPIPIHKKAYDRSVSILCDKKGFKGVMEEYESENTCTEGKEKILKNMKYLGTELKLIGLPHVIGKNGRIVSGILKEEDLNSLIK